MIVGTSFQLDFATYTAWLGFPSICAGFVSLGMLKLYFRKSFSADSWTHSAVERKNQKALDFIILTRFQKVASESESSQLDSEWQKSESHIGREVTAEEPPVRKVSAALGLAFLGTTLLLMFILSFWKVPLWCIGLAFGGVMLIKDGLLDLIELRSHRFPTVLSCLKRLPFDLIPFMLGMFILVEALKLQGILK